MQLLAVTDKKTNEDFFLLSERIYQNDKNYIPHIRQDLEKIFNPDKNKLFRLGGELIRWVLYNDDEQCIG
ncbi:MAG: hypothetical protein RLZZ543_437, partial [Bacteroidota bacterium]